MGVTIVGAIVAFVTIPLGVALWRDAPVQPQQTQQISPVEVTTTTAENTSTTTSRPRSSHPTVVQLSLPDTKPVASDSTLTVSTLAIDGQAP